MLGDRVKETTSTTGTGNLTLAGAVTNFQTFNSAFGTNRRFSYWIVDDTNNVWENGIGYLSTSTTLVREKVLSNSSGTTAALSLSAGVKNVFVNESAAGVSGGQHGMTVGVLTNKYIESLHITSTSTTTKTLTADQLYIIPYLLTQRESVNALVSEITTGAGTASNKFRMGIYERNPVTGDPDNLIAETADLDPSSTGVKVGTFTAVSLPAGWYYVAYLSDVAPAVRAYTSGNHLPVNAGIGSTWFVSWEMFRATISPGWTGLPATPAIGAYDSSTTTPLMKLREA